MRVVVPLGPRRVTALVIGVAERAPTASTCRPLISLMDDCPIVPEKLLRLLEWMAEYYLAPVGDALSLAVGRALTTSSHRVVTLGAGGAAERRRLEKTILALLAKAGEAGAAGDDRAGGGPPQHRPRPARRWSSAASCRSTT